jgi:hypothetical protein
MYIYICATGLMKIKVHKGHTSDEEASRPKNKNQSATKGPSA